MRIEDFGWNDRLRSLFGLVQPGGLVPARVVRADRGAAKVETENGASAAVIAGNLDPSGEAGPPAVGDWVALDSCDGTRVIRAILPRTGALARRRPGAADHEQVVAANVDLVLIVESLERGPNPRRIERATALAWDGGAQPVVVLTKADICSDLEASIARAAEGAPFCDVVPLSSVTGEGLDELAGRLVSGTTAVLLGPSGVGKSTLTNRLLGEERLAVAEVRSGDAKGRHTTTSRELVVVPGGGCLIDTPGIRELGLWLDSGAVRLAFPEIEEAAENCRFGDCRHESEPGCAVLEAVELGVLDARRVDSFLRLRKEAENLDLRRDESRRYEIRSRERSFGRMVREAVKLKKNR
ncbi:MAG: ribosome small subunit-dependent GTPase A [Acidobacteriota bacterium]|nr:ribosome small subunit-dependent GTPase A [Acidobacteriota bacterium]